MMIGGFGPLWSFMKGELKAGGLALVIFSYYPELVGKGVTLVQLLQPGDTFTAPDDTYSRWTGDFPVWLVTGDLYAGDNHGKPKYYGWALFRPVSLMPIDGDDDQEPEQLAKDKPAELTA